MPEEQNESSGREILRGKVRLTLTVEVDDEMFAGAEDAWGAPIEARDDLVESLCVEARQRLVRVRLAGEKILQEREEARQKAEHERLVAEAQAEVERRREALRKAEDGLSGLLRESGGGLSARLEDTAPVGAAIQLAERMAGAAG